MGSGGLLNSKDGSTARVAPLATEVSLGLNLRPNITFDINVLVARDVDEAAGTSKATYVGFRPGIRAYLGRRSLRPYLRAAMPIQYNSDTKSVDVGLLLGGGLEYRFARSIGVFGEAIVSPFFTNDREIPIEGRVGVSLHF